MLKINIITLFPELINKHLEYLPYKKAIELGELSVNLVNLRDFAIDARGTVDGKTYGGGVGMILRPEPVFEAVQSLKTTNNIVLLSPKGNKFNQKIAQEYSKEDELTFICGRYEGVDARVEENLATELLSVGDYVLSGGESAVIVVTEAVTRLLPGVLDKEASQIESFSTMEANEADDKSYLEFPQYTRPEKYNGLSVPEILLSGNHAEIEKWRKENSKKIN